jgi:hypothetical protein
MSLIDVNSAACSLADSDARMDGVDIRDIR